MNVRLNFVAVLFSVFFIFGAIFFWLHFFYFNRINSFQLVPVRVTIPEGYNLEEVAAKFRAFKNFDKNIFLATAKEGELFPDTYFLTGEESEIDIIKIMEDNFLKKVGSISPQNLIMASILEKEAKTFHDKEIISGILWKRLKAGMPLQVDCAPDTYSCGGLPQNPICNPGIDSIRAAENPTDSPYWYYLSDKKGNIHYAKTFEEHQQNIAKYLTR